MLALAAAALCTARPPKCTHPPRALPPIRTRNDLGTMLRELGLSGPGVELGVKQGAYTVTVLTKWARCAEYVQVDAWMPLSNYADVANVASNTHVRFQRQARRELTKMVSAGYAKRGVQCHNFTTVCAQQYADEYFDFIYVDARHDRLGVLEDLSVWWPKLRRGGVMAGHDYTEQKEPQPWEPWRIPNLELDPTSTGQNWTLSSDGSVDASGRVVKGAVDDFFAGRAPMDHSGRQELVDCPLQIGVTYREPAWNTWMVAKPWPAARGVGSDEGRRLDGESSGGGGASVGGVGGTGASVGGGTAGGGAAPSGVRIIKAWFSSESTMRAPLYGVEGTGLLDPNSSALRLFPRKCKPVHHRRVLQVAGSTGTTHMSTLFLRESLYMHGAMWRSTLRPLCLAVAAAADPEEEVRVCDARASGAFQAGVWLATRPSTPPHCLPHAPKLPSSAAAIKNLLFKQPCSWLQSLMHDGGKRANNAWSGAFATHVRAQCNPPTSAAGTASTSRPKRARPTLAELLDSPGVRNGMGILQVCARPFVPPLRPLSPPTPLPSIHMTSSVCPSVNLQALL